MQSEVANDRLLTGWHGRRLLALPVLWAVFCLLGQPLAAATITVNRYDSHWGGEDGQCSLREAIAAANMDGLFPFTGGGECTAGSGADTIVLTGDVILNQVDNSLLGNSGLPRVTSEITVEGNNWSIIRLSGAGVPPFRFFHVEYPDGDLTLKRTTLENGLTEFQSDGGAIRNTGRLTLVDSRLSQNRSGGYGGAIENQNQLTVRGSTLDDNAAELYSGGGIHNTWLLEMFDSLLLGNTAAERGGGIHNGSFGRLKMVRCRLQENTAAGDGGGIWLQTFIYNHRGGATIVDSVLDRNSSEARGGGIYGSCAKLRLIDSTLAGNIALERGGGIAAANCPFTEDPSDVTVTRSTLSANEALAGGGGLQIDSGLAALIDSTLSGNQAVSGLGGGLLNQGGTVTMTHTTVMDNLALAGSGAGVHNEAGTLTVASSVLADSLGGGTNCSGEIVDGYNNYDDDDSCLWAGVISLVDPNLDDNGGPTETHALLEGSTAIDKTVLCYQYTGSYLDQRGGLRDLICDSGAFEWGTDDQYETSGGPGGNDDVCPGHRIQLGHPEHHLLLDEDWVRFDVQVGATYEIETSNLHGAPPADTWLDLRRDCTTHLDSDDDGGVGVASKIAWIATAEDAEAGGLDVRVREKVAYSFDKGYDLTVTCIANCPACAASGGDSSELADEEVGGYRLIEACDEISAKRTVVFLGGMLELRSGREVRLLDGFEVREGGELAVVIDPSLDSL